MRTKMHWSLLGARAVRRLGIRARLLAAIGFVVERRAALPSAPTACRCLCRPLAGRLGRERAVALAYQRVQHLHDVPPVVLALRVALACERQLALAGVVPAMRVHAAQRERRSRGGVGARALQSACVYGKVQT